MKEVNLDYKIYFEKGSVLKMDRRKFMQKSMIGAGSLAAIPSIVDGGSNSDNEIKEKKLYTPISQIKKPLAIAMWDFSWILRHHRYGEFENWDRVLGELVERGYNAIRFDVMPQFVVSTKEGEVMDEFRSVREDWKPAMWGNDYTMSFRPREALLEFLPLCKKHGVKVGLATWFLPHGTGRTDIFTEKGGLQRAWFETLSFLKAHDLLENVIYVDLLNEYPVNHGYDWLKNELIQRADAQKFKLNNPDAHIPESFSSGKKRSDLRSWFYNDYMNKLIVELKTEFSELDLFASLDQGLDKIDLSTYAALDFHIWFAHNKIMKKLWEIGERDQSVKLYEQNAHLYAHWKENKTTLVKWVEDRIDNVSKMAADHNIVCGNTEGWGPVLWYDHPELDWRFTKESADICVDFALKHDNYKFICTSNFTHPHFKGMWNDVKWHQQITSRIKNG